MLRRLVLKVPIIKKVFQLFPFHRLLLLPVRVVFQPMSLQIACSLICCVVLVEAPPQVVPVHDNHIQRNA